MASQTDNESQSTMTTFCENIAEKTVSLQGQQSESKQNLMDCVSLCDVVLNSVDSILQTVTLSDSDLVGSYKEDSTLCASTQTQFATPLSVQRFRAATNTAATQTCDDLLSDTISAMETELSKSRCKVDVLTEHFRAIEDGFRNDLSHHILATNKAKADLEKSQQEMTKIQDRLKSLERETSFESGDSQVEEYKPEHIQGYRPVFQPKRDVPQHFFAGDTLPPAWARVKPAREHSEQNGAPQWHPHRRPHALPPRENQNYGMPPRSYYDPVGYKPSDFGRAPHHDFGRAPAPHHEFGRHSMHQFGRVPAPPFDFERPSAPLPPAFREYGGPPPPPHHEFAGPAPPPGFLSSPPPSYFNNSPPPKPHPVQTNVKSPNSFARSASNNECHQPGDFVVRPLTPDKELDPTKKISFGVRETLYF